MIRTIRSRHQRYSAVLLALIVLCLLGRPLLAAACDVHDATHHGTSELILGSCSDEAIPASEPGSLLHDLFHVAHCCGAAVTLPTVAWLELGERPHVNVRLVYVSERHGGRLQRLFRPPIFST